MHMGKKRDSVTLGHALDESIFCLAYIEHCVLRHVLAEMVKFLWA